MSAKKLIQRIIASSKGYSQEMVYKETFGVGTDPLAQMAIVFSALIHDCDHRGVPNGVLNKEDPSLAKRYNGKVRPL